METFFMKAGICLSYFMKTFFGETLKQGGGYKYFHAMILFNPEPGHLVFFQLLAIRDKRLASCTFSPVVLRQHDNAG